MFRPAQSYRTAYREASTRSSAERVKYGLACSVCAGDVQNENRAKNDRGAGKKTHRHFPTRRRLNSRCSVMVVAGTVAAMMNPEAAMMMPPMVVMHRHRRGGRGRLCRVGRRRRRLGGRRWRRHIPSAWYLRKAYRRCGEQKNEGDNRAPGCAFHVDFPLKNGNKRKYATLRSHACKLSLRATNDDVAAARKKHPARKRLCEPH